MSGLTNMPVSFPGLFPDWEINIDPVALNIGNGVYWYGILICLGVIVAGIICCKKAPSFGLTEDHILDGVIWGIPSGVIGARLYYVIFYLDLFKDADGKFDWGKAIAIWDGGLAIYGTIIGVVLMLIIYCSIKKVKLSVMTDIGMIGIMIGQIIGRWGNFINREAFGSETTLPWRMRVYTSVVNTIDVHPTFLYESLWNLIGLILVLTVVAKARRFDGEVTCFYGIWYGIGRFFIEGLRTDSLYLFNWELFGERIRVSQALSLVIVVVSFLVLFLTLAKKPDREYLYVNQVRAIREAETPLPEEAPADAENNEEPVSEE